MTNKMDRELKVTITVLSMIVLLIAALSIYIIGIYNQINFKKEKIKLYKQNLQSVTYKKAEYLDSLNEQTKIFVPDNEELYSSITNTTNQISNTKDISNLAQLNNSLYSSEKELISIGAQSKVAKTQDTFLNAYNTYALIEQRLTTVSKEYNDMIESYNKDIYSFPKSLVAKTFKFNPETTAQYTQIVVETLSRTSNSSAEGQDMFAYVEEDEQE